MANTGSNPDETFARAVEAHRSGRLDEAEGLYLDLLDVAPDHPEILNLLGAIYGQRGHPAAAAEWLRRAVAADSRHSGALYNLGTACLELERFEEAASAFGRTLDIEPDRFDAAFNLGKAHLKLKAPELAAEAFAAAMRLQPDNLSARREYAATLSKLERNAEAVEILEDMTASHEAPAEAWYEMGFLKLKKREWSGAVEAFDGALAREPWHVRSIANKAIALHEAGRDAEAAQLADLDRLIVVGRLEYSPSDRAALSDILARHRSVVWERPDTTTRAGGQTGNLVDDPDPVIAGFVDRLITRIEAHVASMKADPAHPFTRRIPDRWRFSIWATILDDDGHQEPHLHPAGWMSGVYYADVPEFVLEPDNAEKAGWIEFGAPGYGISAMRPPPLRLIRPEPDTLVFFPSCFFHRTVPLERPGRRISIAFDLIPTSWGD